MEQHYTLGLMLRYTARRDPDRPDPIRIYYFSRSGRTNAGRNTGGMGDIT
jgi:hypothetical protein